MIGPMNYRELAASPDLSYIVLSYWEFTITGETTQPYIHEVFPDGCISLTYYRNLTNTVSWLHVVGPRLDPFRVKVFAGDTFWGARLSPAACRRVLGCDPVTIQNHILPCAQILPHVADKLFQELSAGGGFAEAVAAYDSCLHSLGVKPTDVDLQVAAAVRMIEANKGQIKIAKIAAAVGLSVRQLERRFRAVVGLTPKQFARLRRVRATAIGLVEEAEMSLAARAAEMGYADQAHLTREFVAVTGRSPVAFAADVAKIKHGDFVK